MLIDLLWRCCGLLEEMLGWDSIGYSWRRLSLPNSSDLLEISEEALWRLALLGIRRPALFAVSKRKRCSEPFHGQVPKRGFAAFSLHTHSPRS